MNRANVIVAWVLGFACPASAIGQESGVRSGQPRLSADDKKEITEVRALQARVGDDVWPGFGRAAIPIVLYDSSSQFLVTAAVPPQPWVVVLNDEVDGRPYYRRDLAQARSFAVRVGNAWAGSLSTLGEMNRRSPMRLGRPVHIAALLHELFHAFQATEAPARFLEALGVYRNESRYPFHDSAFAAQWDREGFLLASALQATSDTSRRHFVAEFLKVRDARRLHSSMDSTLLAFERELEWLEGLGKYVESRLYMLGMSQSAAMQVSRILPRDLFILRGHLGRQDGDLRFYLSGVAQAQLLDELNVGWKTRAMTRGVFLEDLLRESLDTAGILTRACCSHADLT